MSHYFLDSSALIKLYVAETGTSWMRSIAAPVTVNQIFIAQITPVEIVSGVMRRQREDALSRRGARALRLLIDRHVQRDYFVVELTTRIVQRAENLLEAHALRAYDAIQLASALETNSGLLDAEMSPLAFVSADTRLLAAAALEGLATDDPNAHP